MESQITESRRGTVIESRNEESPADQEDALQGVRKNDKSPSLASKSSEHKSKTRKATVLFDLSEDFVAPEDEDQEQEAQANEPNGNQEDVKQVELHESDKQSLLSSDSKKLTFKNLLKKTRATPYLQAIHDLAEIQDMKKVQSPFEMVKKIASISKNIEDAINEFWSGIDIIDSDKLTIDGDNILMLYLYIVLKARIPKMNAYMRVMDEFTTHYVQSISHYGYCLSTLQIAMERMTS